MDIDARYEFLEKVGSGSFATVYRARDNELGREVAIKQIHDQYLEDPKQLDRYWQEAQLLASLQHPNIVTIFDIYRDRGWLILELMQSNLAQRMEGRQMDLRALRTTIAHCLRALKYLHSRGIIHGDVKPGNMMIDARRRVKLGDFGLARRVSDEEGSLLKGTTKYMAPEVVSEEFGEIGPASDLYSLGFSAYDLMCGPNFETLFPGLSAFGRNKQVAWMMWHAAADRKLPAIDRVLEGVPEDVRSVVEKLTEKKQADRYDSADAALSDLKIDIKLVDNGESEIADDAPATEDPERKRRLMLAAAGFGASLIVTIVLAIVFFWPKNETAPTPQNNAWFIRAVDQKDRMLTLVGKREREIKVPANALISLEEGNVSNVVSLKKLLPGDRIEIVYVDDEGTRVMKINAARPYLNTGLVKSIDVKKRSEGHSGTLVLATDDGKGQGELPLKIPNAVSVVLNLDRSIWDKAKTQGDRDQLKRQYPFSIDRIREDDRVEAFHLPALGKAKGRVLTGVLFVHREQVGAGAFVTEVDVPRERLVIQFPDRALNLPLHKECRIMLGKGPGPPVVASLADVRKGDVVAVRYDTEFREITATRGEGRVQDVINLIRAEKKEIVIRNKTIVLPESTQYHVLGKAASFGDLRVGDRVVVLLTAPFGDSNTAVTVTVVERRKS